MHNEKTPPADHSKFFKQESVEDSQRTKSFIDALTGKPEQPKEDVRPRNSEITVLVGVLGGHPVMQLAEGGKPILTLALADAVRLHALMGQCLTPVDAANG